MDPNSKQDHSSEKIAIAAAKAPKPKTLEFVSAAMASLLIADSFNCISGSGEKISIKKSIIEKIPYFKIFFRSELDDDDRKGTNFKPPPKKENGDYILPPEIELTSLKPILAYVETGRPIDLLMNLSAERNFEDLKAHLDFLIIDKPVVGDLNSLVNQMTGNLRSRKRREQAKAAAGEFLVGLALDLFDLTSPVDRMNVFFRMEYILSHPGTFRRRLRQHAYAIAKIYLIWLTNQQREDLEKWDTTFSANCSDSGSSTEESSLSEGDEEKEQFSDEYYKDQWDGEDFYCPY